MAIHEAGKRVGVPVLLTVDEVADALRKSKWAVYRLIRAGSLAAYKVGDSWRVAEADLSEYLASTRSG